MLDCHSKEIEMEILSWIEKLILQKVYLLYHPIYTI